MEKRFYCHKDERDDATEETKMLNELCAQNVGELKLNEKNLKD